MIRAYRYADPPEKKILFPRLCWSRVPGLLPVSAASPSMDHEHGTVCHPILEHQIRPSAPPSVISRPTCLSGSLRCCWQVGSAPFVRRRCDCLASSAPFTNIQTYLLTYLLTRWRKSLMISLEFSMQYASMTGGQTDRHRKTASTKLCIAVNKKLRYRRQTSRRICICAIRMTWLTVSV